MTVAVNSAALFFQQFNHVPDNSPSEGLKATVVGVYDGGLRVDVVVRKPATVPQTPDSIWTERAVPFVADGATPPATGFFVTPTDFTFPAPPSGS
jgi:hypothetical protein